MFYNSKKKKGKNPVDDATLFFAYIMKKTEMIVLFFLQKVSLISLIKKNSSS